MMRAQRDYYILTDTYKIQSIAGSVSPIHRSVFPCLALLSVVGIIKRVFIKEGLSISHLLCIFEAREIKA
jgi:hypothetical protein